MVESKPRHTPEPSPALPGSSLMGSQNLNQPPVHSGRVFGVCAAWPPCTSCSAIRAGLHFQAQRAEEREEVGCSMGAALDGVEVFFGFGTIIST